MADITPEVTTHIILFAVPTGFEPVPRTVTGWNCNHSTTRPKCGEFHPTKLIKNMLVLRNFLFHLLSALRVARSSSLRSRTAATTRAASCIAMAAAYWAGSIGIRPSERALSRASFAAFVRQSSASMRAPMISMKS